MHHYLLGSFKLDQGIAVAPLNKNNYTQNYKLDVETIDELC